VSVIKTESIRAEALESIAESQADSTDDQDVMKWIAQVHGALAKARALLGLTRGVYQNTTGERVPR
jgi:hypothetical protein